MKKKTAKTKKETSAPAFPKIYEGFSIPWNISPNREPSAFNGEVSVIRYRITVEIIPEPVEVIHARLVDLWEKCDNHHHLHPIREKAKQFGLELESDNYGKRRAKR